MTGRRIRRDQCFLVAMDLFGTVKQASKHGMSSRAFSVAATSVWMQDLDELGPERHLISNH